MKCDSSHIGKVAQNYTPVFRKGVATALILACAALAKESADVKHESTRIGAWTDLGQIVQGRVDNGVEVDMQVISRSKVALTQQATINERLLLTGAVGGLFFYSMPTDPGGAHTRLTKFTAVLEEASAYYRAGDLDAPSFDSRFGLFFVKYNPDTKNLGEYLFRSGTYPGYLQTGGWYILNSAGYFMQGIRASGHFLDNTLHPEFFFYMERDYEPTYDLTPAFMLTYTPSPAFQAGIGVAMNHLIPAKPSYSTLTEAGNAYYTDATGKQVLVLQEDGERLDSLPGVGYYTFKGTKVMARASFNLQALLNAEILNPQDLKIYAEMAVLGIKDYPVYYDNIAKRIPIMAGINLPTFKLVDMMSFEVEYYNSDYPNNLKEVHDYLFAVPGIDQRDAGTQRRQDYVDSISTQRAMRDKVKWTFWLQKQLATGLGLTFQVASDHFRPMNFNTKPTYEPATQNWNDWYYMFRISFGI